MIDAVDILLVEDNPADAELTIRALKKNHLANSMHHVTDGEEALDFLHGKGKYSGRNRKNHPKVVLLDLKLPKVSGIEVLESMKNDPELKSIPVVALTSSREEPDMTKCYELGINSYVVKPVDFEQFVKAVSELGLYWLLINESPS